MHWQGNLPLKSADISGSYFPLEVLPDGVGWGGGWGVGGVGVGVAGETCKPSDIAQN